MYTKRCDKGLFAKINVDSSKYETANHNYNVSHV